MTKPHAIGLLGFSAFERSTFDSFFRLAARRVQGYEIVDGVAGSALVVANADDEDAMGELLARPPAVPVLLVGASDGGTGWPLQSRPIKLMAVLTAIDQMLMPQAAPPARARRPSRSPKSDFPATRPFADARSTAPAAAHAPGEDGILVVDDNDTALQFMRNRLRRFGFSAELARSGEEAIEKLRARPYRFVFLEASLEGMDGYQTCKAIKHRKYADGKPPVVVMLSTRAGAVDKVLGSMAGCDEYMAKPLEEGPLLKLLAKYDDQVQRGFQATNLGTEMDRPPPRKR